MIRMTAETYPTTIPQQSAELAYRQAVAMQNFAPQANVRNSAYHAYNAIRNEKMGAK